MATSLTRVVRFNARHQMRVASWTETRNRETFGPLTELHEHEYRCAVTVRGVPDALGMVVDLAALDQILREEVLQYAGADLNRAVPRFREGQVLPTCEAFAELLFARIATRLPGGVQLDRVVVAEDESLSAECAGPA